MLPVVQEGWSTGVPATVQEYRRCRAASCKAAMSSLGIFYLLFTTCKNVSSREEGLGHAGLDVMPKSLRQERTSLCPTITPGLVQPLPPRAPVAPAALVLAPVIYLPARSNQANKWEGATVLFPCRYPSLGRGTRGT